MFTISGTIAQSDATARAAVFGSPFSITGGFWAATLPRCDADINNDGFVNSLDLGLLQKAMGSSTGQAAYNPRADMNGDGRINALDLGLFRARFGRPPGDY